MKKLCFYAEKVDLFGDKELVTIVALCAIEDGEVLYDDGLVYESIDNYSSVLETYELQEGYYEVKERLKNKSIEEINMLLVSLGLELNEELKEFIEEDFYQELNEGIEED